MLSSVFVHYIIHARVNIIIIINNIFLVMIEIFFTKKLMLVKCACWYEERGDIRFI